jgi:hypothetical protein
MVGPIGSLIGFFGGAAILFRMKFGHQTVRRETMLVILGGTILLMVGILIYHLIFGCWQA